MTPAMTAGIAAHEAVERTTADNWVGGNHEDAAYNVFLQNVNDYFAATTKGKPVFTTTSSVLLWGDYIGAFPTHERQVHNCNACRSFIERFGSLAVVNEDGTLISALWNEDFAPAVYRDSIARMRMEVERSRVTGVFISDEKMFGQPKTGRWTHLHAKNPAVFKQRGRTAYQEHAEKRQDYMLVQRALHDYIPAVVNKAVTLLESEALYRAEKVIGPVKWLQALQRKLTAKGGNMEFGFVVPLGGNARINVTWLAVATAPAGFAHVRSSMAGTLLDDIVAGKALDDVARAFAAKMRPDTYQRPQAAPSAGTIAAAERAFVEMGLAPSLQRRFARIDEIEAVWAPYTVKQVGPTEGALFGNVQPKQAKQPTKMALPTQTMTWEKFQRTVLQDATSIELYAPGRGTYTAIATAVHADAPPILQWDSEERRNPFSWYLYMKGSYAADFNVRASTFVKVNAITLKPSMWQPGFDHQGKGVILILEGCADNRDSGNALFPEILRSDLHPYRSVIEAFSRQSHMQQRPAASACGYMLQDGSTWGVQLRVTTRDSVRAIILDRWD